MVDFVSSIKKPFSDLKTLVIGGVLNAIPIVSLISSGFVLKTAEDAVAGKAKLREFAVSDIVDYIVKVVLSAIISIVYMIPGLIVSAIGVGAAIASVLPSLEPMLASGAYDPTAITGLVTTALATGGVILLVGILLLLVAAFILPMAIMRWLSEESLGAAFNVLTVVKKALTLNYIVTLIVYIVYAIVAMIIAGIIGGILGMIPAIGFLLSLLLTSIVGFAVSVTAYDMIAQAYKA